MNRYRRKVDGNQAEVVAALRRAGWAVCDLHVVGRGLPDLLVARHGVNMLVEVKKPGELLSAREKKFFSAWPGAKVIAYGAQDAIDKLSEIG